MWDHFHGGVPSHHLLANKELPKISNWWGALSIPLISYLLLNSIKKRIRSADGQASIKLIKKETYSFFIAVLFAIVIAVSFTTGNTGISDLLFLGLPVIALFFPIYHPAYLLGFITGMMYTFGGVLPIVAAFIMSVICYLIYISMHPLLVKIGKMTGLICTSASHINSSEVADRPGSIPNKTSD
jgi:hypothetical protein